MEDTTADTLTTAVPIMGDIHTVHTGTDITPTDMGPTPTTGRLIRPTITGASIAVTADQRSRASRNGSPVPDIIVARLMAECVPAGGTRSGSMRGVRACLLLE